VRSWLNPACRDPHYCVNNFPRAEGHRYRNQEKDQAFITGKGVIQNIIHYFKKTLIIIHVEKETPVWGKIKKNTIYIQI